MTAPEAFMVMRYRTNDGNEEELIWNSRDGVTPFVVQLRSGKEARHVAWSADRYEPDYSPPVGSRVFVDLTSDHARALAVDRVESAWDHPDFPMSEMFETRDEAEAYFATYYLDDGHQPELIEVREPWTGGRLIESTHIKAEREFGSPRFG